MKFYTCLFSESGVEKLRAILEDRNENNLHNLEMWFTIPDCAILASSTFKRAIASYGNE